MTTSALSHGGKWMHQLAGNFRNVSIYRAPSGKSALYASLVDIGDGEVLCALRTSTMDDDPRMEAGNPWTNLDDEIVCIKSCDGCETWDAGTLRPIFADPEKYDYLDVTSAPLLRDGRLLLPFYQCSPDHDEQDPETWQARLWLTRSSDRGATWTEPTRLDPSPLHSTAAFGGIIRLHSGELLLSCYGEANRDRPDLGRGFGASGVFRSHDEGETWGAFAYVIYEQEAEQREGCRGVNETSITQLGDGRLLAVARSYYDQDDYPLYRSVSSDNGFTWDYARTRLHGLCPCLRWVPQGPAGGTTILAYHDRYLDHQERGGIYLAFSHDCGQTWGYQTYVDTFAYPCLLQLASGEMFLAWYSADHTELKGAFFEVPFPTGIRAEVSAGVVELQWDELRDDTHTYRLHRGLQAGFEPLPDNAIAELPSSYGYRDTPAAGGKAYYVVTAWDGDRQVGKSWEVAVSTE